jgi:hypothetical protein
MKHRKHSRRAGKRHNKSRKKLRKERIRKSFRAT